MCKQTQAEDKMSAVKSTYLWQEREWKGKKDVEEKSYNKDFEGLKETVRDNSSFIMTQHEFMPVC